MNMKKVGKWIKKVDTSEKIFSRKKGEKNLSRKISIKKF